MDTYDRLPSELRNWVASAHLPWSPGSVRRAYAKALSQTGDGAQALQQLETLQRKQIARDVKRIWGDDHPSAARQRS